MTTNSLDAETEHFRGLVARHVASNAVCASLPLMAHPGDAWMYDTSFAVLGVLISRAVGTTLGLLYTRLFSSR